MRIRIHNPLTQEETVLVPEGGKGGKAGRVEGYLFKRGQNAFRTWNRRWFYLDSNKVGGKAVVWIRIDRIQIQLFCSMIRIRIQDFMYDQKSKKIS
jgi:hypothetical protein